MPRDSGCPDFDIRRRKGTSKVLALSLFVLRLAALFSRPQHAWMPLLILGMAVAEPPIARRTVHCGRISAQLIVT